MVKNVGAKGAKGAKGAGGANGAKGGAMFVLALATFSCSYLPASQERAHAMMMLQAVEGVTQVTIGCEGGVFASDGLCADVLFEDGAALRFERVGYDSFGPTAVNVIVSQAGGLVPRVASCSGVVSPNFHRGGALGHHFSPTLIDVKEAVSRHREVMEEIQYWQTVPAALGSAGQPRTEPSLLRAQVQRDGRTAEAGSVSITGELKFAR